MPSKAIIGYLVWILGKGIGITDFGFFYTKPFYLILWGCNVIFFFLIGAIIGWIVGKIKSKKTNPSHLTT